jgi:hypothetical protein
MPNPTPYIHPVLCDEAFNNALNSLDNMLLEVEVFWKAPRVVLHKRTVDFVEWLKSIGASKQAMKWLLPLCTSTTARALAHTIFGRELSPIEELGNRSVSSFIRFMMFERHYSTPKIRQVLIDDLGYSAKIARPLVRRIERDWHGEKQKFIDKSEATLFNDLTFA